MVLLWYYKPGFPLLVLFYVCAFYLVTLCSVKQAQDYVNTCVHFTEFSPWTGVVVIQVYQRNSANIQEYLCPLLGRNLRLSAASGSELRY